MIIQPVPRPPVDTAILPAPALGGDAEVSRQARLKTLYRPETHLPPEPLRRQPAWFDRA